MLEVCKPFSLDGLDVGELVTAACQLPDYLNQAFTLLGLQQQLSSSKL